MRVIAGEFRSRRLKSAPGQALRPTPDRLREALFNVVATRITGCTFLDLYAGCGAVGIEALSRGAARTIFIEIHRPAVRVIQENLRALGIEDRAVVVCGRAAVYLSRFSADVVFLDPPYELQHEYEEALGMLSRRPPPLVVAQHAARNVLKESYGPLHRTRVLRQGDTVLSFFEPVTVPRASACGRSENPS
jgi:16S rRNA (guanine(966)-N(2))-methyltransferase RsmD